MIEDVDRTEHRSLINKRRVTMSAKSKSKIVTKTFPYPRSKPGYSYEYDWPGRPANFCGRMGAFSKDDVRAVIREKLGVKRLPNGFTVERY